MPAIFVSGAAAGIGRAIAVRFAREGWSVGAGDVDEEGLASLAAEHANISGGPLDVRKAASWKAALAAFADVTDGRLDVLVNNAGVLEQGSFADITLTSHRRQVEVNALGVLQGAHAAHPWLRATPGARLVNMASASAVYGTPGLATYSATKHFVRALTEALDIEWQDDDIRVMAIWPLFVQTAMVDAQEGSAALERLGVKSTPGDIADAVWDAVHDRRPDHRVHFTVGLQTKVLYGASKLSPNFLNRLLTRRMSR
ncbi:MAG: SDR family oxidoreductase [Nitriliruptorales bacterium]|nr:SDR family oxidoreductase [Nitriliruptorales bacterium]